MIEWDESLSVGVPEMDDEHKELIRMINRTQELLELGRRKDALEFFEQGLARYTETHLSDEEEFMERIGYPKLAEHKKQHELFRKKVQELGAALKEKDLDKLQEALDLGWAWIYRHITGADREYGLYYQKEVLKNRAALLRMAPVEEELKNVFTEFYFRLINTPHLARFFRDAYQVSELTQKQVDFVKSYLYALDESEREEARRYFEHSAWRHAKLGINPEDMAEYIDFLGQKLQVLHHAESLRGVKEQEIKEFVEFMKEQTYKAYLKNSLERSIQNWRLHIELLGDLAAAHIETLQRLLDAVERGSFEPAPFATCAVTRYMSSARFFIQGYAVKEILNMALITHQRFHTQLDEIAEAIVAKNYKKAYELSRNLVRDSDALEGFLLYIQLLWEKSPEENFFDFLMDPINADKMVGVVLIPSEPTKNAKEIFSKFNSILVDLVNASQNPELFAFNHIDYQDDIYRGYIVHFSLAPATERSDALELIKSCYQKAMERLGEEYNIEDVAKNYIKMIPFETKAILERFRFSKEEFALFVDRIEKESKSSFDLERDGMDDELIKLVFDVKREYRILQKLTSLKHHGEAPFLELYAHPIVSFESEEVVALELLSRIRLDHSSDPVSAANFIDLVKKQKLTDIFDMAVLKKVREFLEGLDEPFGYLLFVNLFPSSYFDLEIDRMIREISALGRKKAKGVVFEMTEQENYDMDSIIKTLRRYDAQIAIDDFGSGYSNFDKFISLLKTDNLKFIKIDGELVKNVLDEVYKKGLRHICSLALEFQKQVIFEFIESERIERELRSILDKSGLGQGYHYGRPRPLAEFVTA